MLALADDLRAFLENRVVRAHRTGALVELRKWMQRHRGVVVLAGLLLAVLISSAVALGLLYRRAEGQRVLAERRFEFLRQNPSGERMDFADIPSLASFVETFDAPELERPLYITGGRAQVEQGEGWIRLHCDRSGLVGFGLDDSFAVIRGDFQLSVSLELEGFATPEQGDLFTGLCLRQARDGRLAVHAAVASQTDSEPRYVAHTSPYGPFSWHAWSGPGARLRLERHGDRCRAEVWNDGWKELLSAPVTDEPLIFSVYASSSDDEANLTASVDELLYSARSKPGGVPVGPVVEGFDEGRGPFVVPRGDAGVAGVVDGRMLITNMSDTLGSSTVALDALRYTLRGDFEVRFDYEILDIEGPSEAIVECIFAVDGARPVAGLALDMREPSVVRALGRAHREIGRSGPTAGEAGKLRIRRQGSRVLLEHWSDGWRELATTTDESNDLYFQIEVRNLEQPAGGEIAIDNLSIKGLFVRT